MQQTATLNAVAVLPSHRLGPRPQTQRVIPHRQIDQLPTPEIMEELVMRSLRIPLVRSKQSRMASPLTYALCLDDDIAGGPREAFIDAHEFCHLHPLPDGGIHLTLPSNLREEMIRLGWAEPHPIAVAGILATLVTVYVPRDRHELEVVLFLISQSCLFAQGGSTDLFGSDCRPQEAE